MSKTITAGMNTHLQGDTTLAYCWLVTRRDGTIYGFTNHDQLITYLGQDYEPFSGFSRSATRSAAGLGVNTMDVDGAFSSDGITEADLNAGLWDFATIRAFAINWADLTLGEIKAVKGKLGQVKSGRLAFTVELRSLIQELQQSVGRIYGVLCDAVVGDSRCKVNLALFTVTGAITARTSDRVFTDTARVEATGYFSFGVITFTSGLNNGVSMEVKTSTNVGLISLQLPMPFTVAVGDTYSMSAGCDLSIATCGTKFNNVVNHRGFPYIQGQDQLLSGGL